MKLKNIKLITDLIQWKPRKFSISKTPVVNVQNNNRKILIQEFKNNFLSNHGNIYIRQNYEKGRCKSVIKQSTMPISKNL